MSKRRMKKVISSISSAAMMTTGLIVPVMAEQNTNPGMEEIDYQQAVLDAQNKFNEAKDKVDRLAQEDNEAKQAVDQAQLEYNSSQLAASNMQNQILESVTPQLSQYSQLNNELKQREEKLLESIAQLENELAKLQKQQEEAQKKLEEAKQAKEEANQKVQDNNITPSTIDQLNSEKDVAYKEYESLVNNISKLNEQLKALEDEEAAKEEVKSQLEEELTALNNQLSAAREELITKTNAYESAKAAYEDATSGELGQRIKQAEQELEAAKSDVAMKEAYYNQALDEQQKLQIELEIAQRILQEAIEQEDALHIRTLEENVTALQGELSSLNEQANAYNSTLISASESLYEKQSLLETYQGQLAELYDQKQMANESKTQLESRVSELEEAYNTACNDYNEALNRDKLTEEEFQKYENEVSYYEEKVNEYQNKINNYQQLLEQFDTDLAQIEQERENIYNTVYPVYGENGNVTGHKVASDIISASNKALADIDKYNANIETIKADIEDVEKTQAIFLQLINGQQSILDDPNATEQEKANAQSNLEYYQSGYNQNQQYIAWGQGQISTYSNYLYQSQAIYDSYVPSLELINQNLAIVDEMVADVEKERFAFESEQPYLQQYLEGYQSILSDHQELVEIPSKYTRKETIIKDKTSHVYEAQMLLSIAAAKVQAIEVEYGDEINAINEREDAYNEILTELNTLKARKDELTEQIAAKQAKLDELPQSSAWQDEMDLYNQGSVGFFKWLEELGYTTSQAYEQLLDPNDVLAQYTQLGIEGDATNIDMMLDALRWVKVGNEIREEEGLNTLSISILAMAQAQLNANFSATHIQHSYQGPFGENLAWGTYVDQVRGHGPYDGWYDSEKAVYFFMQEHPDYTEEQVAQAMGINLADVQTGHYLNLITPGYTTTGFATTNNKGQYANTYSQTFGRGYKDTTSVIDIDTFISLLMRYYEEEMPMHFEYKVYEDDLTRYDTTYYYTSMTRLNGISTSADELYNTNVQINELNPQLVALQEQHELDVTRKEFLDGIHNDALKKLEAASKQVEKAYSELSEANNIEENTGDIGHYKGIMENYKLLLDEANQALSEVTTAYDGICSNIESTETEIATLEEEIGKISADIDAIRGELEALQSQYEQDTQALYDAQSALINAKDLKVLIDVAGKESTVDQYESLLASAQDNVTSTNSALSLARVNETVKQQEYDSQVSVIQEVKDAYDQAKLDKENVETTISNLEQSISEKETAYTSINDELEALNTTESDIRNNIQMSMKSRDEAYEKYSQALSRIQYLQGILNEYNVAQSEYNEAKTAYDGITSQVNTKEEALSSLNTELSDVQSDKKDAENRFYFLISVEQIAQNGTGTLPKAPEGFESYYNSAKQYMDLLNTANSYKGELEVAKQQEFGIHQLLLEAVDEAEQAYNELKAAEEAYNEYLNPSLTGIELNIHEMDINRNEVPSITLEVTYTPATTKDDMTIIWTSSNTSIATVDENGTVTFLKKGTVTITATSVMGFEDSCTITIDDFGWKENSKGVWYQREDGTYPKAKWESIGGEWYYFDESGYLVTGWKKLNNKWYYLGEDGVMVTGYQIIDTVPYYFNDNGSLYSGWKDVEGTWYYFTTSGAVNGWKKINEKWYYFDLYEMVTGLQVIDGQVYRFNDNGSLFTGWYEEDGVWFYFTTTGAVQNAWKQINNKWYYFDKDGIMVKGIQEIDGKLYNMTTGAMSTTAGWYHISDADYYYFQANGKAATGWLKVGTKWYYFHEDNWKMAHDEVLVLDGVTYTFNTNGSYTKG